MSHVKTSDGYDVSVPSMGQVNYNTVAGSIGLANALNATWHDFAALFGEWFSAPADSHFVKAAIAFWFDDEDYSPMDERVWNYFN